MFLRSARGDTIVNIVYGNLKSENSQDDARNLNKIVRSWIRLLEYCICVQCSTCRIAVLTWRLLNMSSEDSEQENMCSMDWPDLLSDGHVELGLWVCSERLWTKKAYLQWIELTYCVRIEHDWTDLLFSNHVQWGLWARKHLFTGPTPILVYNVQ
jgi:hypothetical protein